MTWACRLIENPELDEHGNVDFSKREIGDMWFIVSANRELTDQYWRDNAGRPPVVVLLPGRTPFLVDGKCYNAERGYYDGWTVTGAPPELTVAPSIHVHGRYHGFLQNGVLTDPL